MPTQEQVEWFLKTGAMYGLGFVLLAGFIAIILVVCWRTASSAISAASEWGPKLLQAHVDFLEEVKVSNKRMADAVETIAHGGAASEDSHKKTHKALRHIAIARQSETATVEVKNELQKAIDALNQ